MIPRAAILALALAQGAALAARAETDFTALTPEERAAFHAEIRAVLLADPALAAPAAGIRPAPAYPAPAYEEEIASDRALIAANADALFDPALPGFGPPSAAVKIALFTGPDCPACARARKELESLAQSHDLRVTLLDTGTNPQLRTRLGVDTLPFYVLPKMMLRGHLPPVVLERYLTQGTGQ